jgi:acetoin utilization deacetylase AcuC-like enzyme
MAASRVTAVVEDSHFLDHRGPAGHPERPERLTAVHAALAPRRDRLDALAPRPATREEILRIHSPDHVDRISRACETAPAHLDPDTYVSPESFDVGLLAAGGTVDLARAIAAGRVQAGLASVRPPGHHAEADRAMGFCLFNNIAVAARALQAEDGFDRVLILDWDVHHGNGTQHSFEEDPAVLYVSTHQYPYYPGTGAASEAGRGRGAGFTLNIPMPAGCGDAEYVGAFQRILVPAARTFRPDFLLVSCGFDAHRDDPLAGMQVTGDGYAAMAAIVRHLADELCGGRLAFVLEGGYALSGVREGTAAVLDAIIDPEAPNLPPVADLDPGSPLERIVEQAVQVHRRHFPDLGSA